MLNNNKNTSFRLFTVTIFKDNETKKPSQRKKEKKKKKRKTFLAANSYLNMHTKNMDLYITGP